MNLEHNYTISSEWSGNRGTGTSGYRDYDRTVTISADGKPSIFASADRPFFGDADRWNPEELLLAALSECHLLSFLHVAAENRVVVLAYTDDASGTMVQTRDGGGHFTGVVLRPRVMLAEPNMIDLANSLHRVASERCFIAASVNFPVHHEPLAFVLV